VSEGVVVSLVGRIGQLRCCVLFAIAFALPLPAHAAYETRHLAIELLVARDEAPEYACVVYSNGSVGNAIAMPRVEGRASAARSGYVLERAADDLYSVKQVRGSKSPTTTDRAFEALALPDETDTCGETDACAARVEQVASDLRVSCARNIGAPARRVVLLRLHLPGDREGEVFGVSLDGNMVSVTGEWGQDRPTAYVLGGHYFHGDAGSAREDNRMQLRLQARCVRRELRLPPTIRRPLPAARGRNRPPEWQITVDPTGRDFPREGAPSAACRRTLCSQNHVRDCVTDSMPVLLQQSQSTRRVTAVLKLPPTTRDDRAKGYDVLLESRWDQDLAPPVLPLQAYRIRFEWLTRCELPLIDQAQAGHDAEAYEPPRDGATCPRVDLIEAGVSCSAGFLPPTEQTRDRARTRRVELLESQPLCVYECAAPEGASAFSLPLTVRFAAGDQEDAWREQLSHIDQVLSGFTPESIRQFRIRTAREIRHDRDRGDKLETLRVWTPSGLKYEFRVTPDPDTWPALTVPGGRCGSTLAYQYTGTRSFTEDVTQISDGYVDIPAPRQTAVRWTWGALVAPALIGTLLTTEDVAWPPWGAALLAKLTARYQPTLGDFARGLTIEVAAGFLLSRSPYYALDVPDSFNGPHASLTYSSRVWIEGAVMLPMSSWLMFKDGWGAGALLGFGMRLPTYERDRLALGGHPFFVAVGAFIRSRLGGFMWLELSAHYFLFEPVQLFSIEQRAHQQPSSRRLASHTLAFAFGPHVFF
jgi:hypothetical protein